MTTISWHGSESYKYNEFQSGEARARFTETPQLADLSASKSYVINKIKTYYDTNNVFGAKWDGTSGETVEIVPGTENNNTQNNNTSGSGLYVGQRVYIAKGDFATRWSDIACSRQLGARVDDTSYIILDQQTRNDSAIFVKVNSSEVGICWICIKTSNEGSVSRQIGYGGTPGIGASTGQRVYIDKGDFATRWSDINCTKQLGAKVDDTSYVILEQQSRPDSAIFVKVNSAEVGICWICIKANYENKISRRIDYSNSGTSSSTGSIIGKRVYINLGDFATRWNNPQCNQQLGAKVDDTSYVILDHHIRSDSAEFVKVNSSAVGICWICIKANYEPSISRRIS
jgi:hypothetical protein